MRIYVSEPRRPEEIPPGGVLRESRDVGVDELRDIEAALGALHEARLQEHAGVRRAEAGGRHTDRQMSFSVMIKARIEGKTSALESLGDHLPRDRRTVLGVPDGL